MEAAAWVAVILFFGLASFCSSAMIFAPFISESIFSQLGVD
jgi:hypothetical protein